MEYHEIDMRGRIWIEEVSSLPTWHSSYKRRLILVNGTLWYGSETGWVKPTIEGASTSIYLRKDIDDVHYNTISPSADNIYDLGKSDKRYANVYAVSFEGVVTTATYADLAEKYTAPEEYSVGTVVRVSDSNMFDIEKVDGLCRDVIGVVSENPGFLMNNSIDGQIIGIKGRLPVRVIGPISKRDPIVPSEDGCARKGIHHYTQTNYYFGYALEDNFDNEVKLVECFIR